MNPIRSTSMSNSSSSSIPAPTSSSTITGGSALSASAVHMDDTIISTSTTPSYSQPHLPPNSTSRSDPQPPQDPELDLNLDVWEERLRSWKSINSHHDGRKRGRRIKVGSEIFRRGSASGTIGVDEVGDGLDDRGVTLDHPDRGESGMKHGLSEDRQGVQDKLCRCCLAHSGGLQGPHHPHHHRQQDQQPGPSTSSTTTSSAIQPTTTNPNQPIPDGRSTTKSTGTGTGTQSQAQAQAQAEAQAQAQAQEKCPMKQEIEAVEGDLMLSAEIGLTLLNRLNTLQATYDPLFISHTTLQTTYTELVRSSTRAQDKADERVRRAEEEVERSEEARKRVEDELGEVKRELERMMGRLKRVEMRRGGEEKEVEEMGDEEGATRLEGLKAEALEREKMVRELVQENALLKHRLERVERESPSPIVTTGLTTEKSTPVIAGPTLDELKRRKRMSLGYRSGSWTGSGSVSSETAVREGSSTVAREENREDPLTIRSYRHPAWAWGRYRSENAIETVRGKMDDDISSAPGPTGQASEGKSRLRPLSLSLSVSSRYTHAGPSSSTLPPAPPGGLQSLSASASPNIDEGPARFDHHHRQFSLTPSFRSNMSDPSKRSSISVRGSYAGGPGAAGGSGTNWDSLVRDADGVPVWPQPDRVTSQTTRIPGSRSGSGSGSDMITTSPRTTLMGATGGGSSVGYSLNGVKRSMSVDRSRGYRKVSSGQTVDSIAETGHDTIDQSDTAIKPAEMEPAVTTRQRRRMSRYYQSPTCRAPTSPLINQDYSFASSEHDSMVEGDSSGLAEGDRTDDSEQPPANTTVISRPGMSESKSTQTDPIPTESTPRPTRDAEIRLTLGGLGFEEETPGSSSRTTPQMPSPFSPASPYNHAQMSREGSVEARTGALLLLVDHVSKILIRLRQADVPNLTRRLKKHHLAGGDVGHLSRGEMKALTNEIGEMRAHFRNIMEEERRVGRTQHPLHDSTITRKDFQLLLKLFKEIFGELIELRGIVNDVTVNPALAVELRKRQEALQAEEEEARGRGKAVKSAGGLGWIAAPITKLFAAPSTEPPGKRSSDKTLLQPPSIRSSAKLMPSTSATTTQVSVEFASSGQIRRATAALPAHNADHLERLPASPVDTLTKMSGVSRQTSAEPSVRTPSIPLGDGSSRGPPQMGNRQSFYGIFAGGSSVLDERQGINPRSSQTIGGRHGPGRHRRQLSTVVDAVIDDDGVDRGGDDYQAPLLERTLRPRGLSDSSIRTTFQHHGIEIPAGRIEAPPASQYGSYWPTSTVVKTLGRRIQALTGNAVVAAPSSLPSSTADESVTSQDTTAIQTPSVTNSSHDTLQVSGGTLEPRTITKKRSANQLGLISPASLTDGGGFLSMLSTSATGELPTPPTKNPSPGVQRSESRTRRSRAYYQS